MGYEERARPSFIRDHLHDRDYPARGSFAVVPETGAVLASEIGIEDQQGKHRIVVEYSWVEKLGLWLPAEMRENYEFRRGADWAQGIIAIQDPAVGGQGQWRPARQTERLEGAARYSKARRFGVTTDERLTPPQ